MGTGRHIGVEVGSCEYQLEYKVCFGFYGVGRGGQGHQIGVKAELERLTGPSVPGKKHVWAGWARDCTGSRDSRKAVRGSPHTLRETANTIPIQPCGIIWSVIASPSTREMSCLVPPPVQASLDAKLSWPRELRRLPGRPGPVRGSHLHSVSLTDVPMQARIGGRKRSRGPR